MNDLVDLHRRLVDIDSPSTDKAAVDRLQDLVEESARVPGAVVERIPTAGYGDHVRVRYGEGTGQLLVLCHVDTVWPLGEASRRPFTIADGRALGPGSSDMKGGVALALHVLRRIATSGHVPASRLCFIFNSDEEVGSPTSRELIETEARASQAVFVLESGFPPDGAVKTFRKGWGHYLVRVRGRAAHAGADHALGRSAIKELAAQVLRIEALTDYDSGTTLNVGTISGGTRVNVVPEQAEAAVDVRITSAEAASKVHAALRGLQPIGEGVEVEISGGFNRPPFERTPGVAALYEWAREIAHQLGFELSEVGMGGASDGNFSAALAIPTLDGLGLVGEGAHSLDEFVLLEHNERRVLLLEQLLLRPLQLRQGAARET